MDIFVSACGSLIIHPPKVPGGPTTVNISVRDNNVYMDGFYLDPPPSPIIVNQNTVVKERTKLSAKGKSPYGPQRNK